MILVEGQGLGRREHIHIHAGAGHAVHTHHILHAAAFFLDGKHGGDLLILQALHLNGKLVIADCFLEELRKRLCVRLQLLFVRFF